MRRALQLIDAAFKAGPAGLACSGGMDSMALLDLIYTRTPHRPPVVHVSNGLDWPETRSWVEEQCARYGAPFHVAEPKRTPQVQWKRTGFPMLGKLQAPKWNKKHPDFGFRLDCTGCCLKLKIEPGRKLTKALGRTVQITGLRGDSEAAIRGKYDKASGPIRYNKTHKLWTAAPLSGWTDLMVRRYTRQNKVPQHPARARGALTIGCVACGGGSQFTSSAFRRLRRMDPYLWRRYMVAEGFGPIILAVKHNAPLDLVEKSLKVLGGLEQVAEERPWVFDFTRPRPMPGNRK